MLHAIQAHNIISWQQRGRGEKGRNQKKNCVPIYILQETHVQYGQNGKINYKKNRIRLKLP